MGDTRPREAPADGLQDGTTTKKVPFGIKNQHLPLGKTTPKAFGWGYTSPDAAGAVHGHPGEMGEGFPNTHPAPEKAEQLQIVFNFTLI